MTPKTQSVCKCVHCEKSVYFEGNYWLLQSPATGQKYEMCAKNTNGRHEVEPVSEPASTGEPPECGQFTGRYSHCKMPRGHSGSCNPLHGIVFEAARPSEPSAPDGILGGVGSAAPQTSAEHDIGSILPVSLGSTIREKLASEKLARRYFPPASQTSLHFISDASEDEQKQDCCGDRYACTYRYKCSCGKLACRSHMEYHAMKVLATPASTARTDGLSLHKLCHLLNEESKDVMGTHYEQWASGLQRAITLIEAGIEGGYVAAKEIASPAAPGSVPQAPKMESEEANKPPEHCVGCAKLEVERDKYRDESEFFQREMDNFRRNRDHRIVQLEAELAGAAQPGDDKPEGAK